MAMFVMVGKWERILAVLAKLGNMTLDEYARLSGLEANRWQ